MDSVKPAAGWAIVTMTAFFSCGGRTELFGPEPSDVTGASVGSGGITTGNTSEVGGSSDGGVGNGGQSNLGGSSATGGFSSAATGGVAATGGAAAGGSVSHGGVGNGGQSDLAGSSAIGGFSSAATGGVAATGGAAAGGGSSTTISVIELALAGEHTCVLLSSGSIRCWGSGSYGELGYGNTDALGDDETPSSAGDVSLGNRATGVGIGYYHTCAVLTAGKVRCWGLGSDGELGYGNGSNVGDDEVPDAVDVVNVGEPTQQIVGGSGHTCALLTSGHVRCWGSADYGALGYGNTITTVAMSPAALGNVDVGGTVEKLAAGNYHTCALLTTGRVRCWGYGYLGTLGYGSTDNIGDDETPAVAGDVNIGDLAIDIAAGHAHTCALLQTGAVRCWGRGSDGELGYGNTNNIGDDESPASVGDVSVGEGVAALSAGGHHTCALLDSGNVRCWGSSAHGELGYGNVHSVGDNETPASVGNVDVGGRVTHIATGEFHTCTLLESGHVRCWGSGLHGQLGYGNTYTIGDGEAPASAGDVMVF